MVVPDVTTLPDDVATVVDRWHPARRLAGIEQPRHCILAAATLVALFPDRAVPYACSVMYANRLAQSHLGQLRGRRLADVDDQAFTIGVLTGERNGTGTGVPLDGTYDGHVVVLVDGRWLVDLTAPAYDRPARGLRVRGPVVLDLETSGAPSALWGRGGKQWDLTELGVGTGWCHYTLLPDVTDWQAAPDWRFPDRRQPILDQLAAL